MDSQNPTVIKEYDRKKSRGKNHLAVDSIYPDKREDVVKWCGWGYANSKFYFKNGIAKFSDERYPICNEELPYFKQYIEEKFNVNPRKYKSPNLRMPDRDRYPIPKITEMQLTTLKTLNLKISTEGTDRLLRSKGQSPSEILEMRSMIIRRIPDVVVWPECHEDVVEVVRICHEHDIVVIPYGGGSTTTGSVSCCVDESRTILSLDTSRMNEILWLDEAEMMACCESGIVGQDLERALRQFGFTCGHEPDSFEFSTLGGWVATRSDGMKKSRYGSVEDIVVYVRSVTPGGVLEKNANVKYRKGPDLTRVIIGAEGCLGVITEVTIRIRPLPAVSKFGSLLFPDFEAGLKFVQDVARQRLQPAAMRLMDNDQLTFCRIFRHENSYFGFVFDGIREFYLSRIKGYTQSQMSFVMLLYEGERHDVGSQETKINNLAAYYGGVPAGENNGKICYETNFIIPYVRDAAMKFNIITHYIDTFISWDKADCFIETVKRKITEEHKQLGVRHHVAMCRVSNVMDTGCDVRFYYMFRSDDANNVSKLFEECDLAARHAIATHGGTLPNRHGLGTSKVNWYEQHLSKVEFDLFKTWKELVDPKNIFATVNFGMTKKNNDSKL